jgi:hypothetical protein
VLAHHDWAVVTADGPLLDSPLPDEELAEDSPPLDEELEDSRGLALDSWVALVLLLLAAAERAGSCPEASCT